MYQQNNTTNGTYYNANPYSVPYQQRYSGMEQGANAAPIYAQQPIPHPFLKGRPVSSFEEARAAAVDFDGSLHIFTDIGNKKIYTKQINVDGTATLKTYILLEDNSANNTEYITRAEFEQTLSQLQANLLARTEDNKSATLNNF